MFNAILNEEGRKAWEYVFPEGIIPINNPYPVKAKLGDIGEQEVYFVSWAVLHALQRETILDFMQIKFRAKRAQVESQIVQNGLPIRASWVSSVSAPSRYF